MQSATTDRYRTTLVERDPYAERLSALLDAGAQARGGAVVVQGPAGIGKTALLAALRQDALARGFATAYASAPEGGEAVGHDLARRLVGGLIGEHPTPVRAMISSGPAALAVGMLRSAPGAGSPGAFDVDAAATVAFGAWELIRAVAAQQPVVLIADDAHWADEASLRLLAYVARRLTGHAVVLVVGVRTGEARSADPLLSALRAGSTVPPLEVAPLSVAGTAELAARRGLHAAEDVIAACHQSTGGNALYLGYLLTDVARRSPVPTVADVRVVGELGAEQWTRGVAGGIASLDAGATALVEAASVLGAESRLSECAALAQLDLEAAADAADALRTLEIFTDASALTFVHALLRTGVYNAIDAERRAALHRHAATLLLGLEKPAPVVARHIMAFDTAGERWVRDCLVHAGQTELRAGAVHAAAGWYTRALEEPWEDEVARAVVEQELAQAQLLAGDAAAASTTMRRAIEHDAEPSRQVPRRMSLATMAADPFDWRGPDAILRAAERQARDAGLEDLALLCRGRRLAMVCVMQPQAIAEEAGLEELFRLPGDTPAERTLLCVLAACATSLARPREVAIELARRGLNGGRPTAEEASASVAPILASAVLVIAEADDLAHGSLRSLEEQVTPVGPLWTAATVAGFRALHELHLGSPQRAQTHALRAVELADRGAGHPVPFVVVWAHAEVLIALDRLDDAGLALLRSGWTREVPAMFMTNGPAHALADLQEAQGQIELAHASYLDAGRREVAAGVPFGPVAPWRLNAAMTAWRLGRGDEARALADEHLDLARRWGVPRATAIAQGVRGSVDDDPEAGITMGADALVGLGPEPTAHTARLRTRLGELQVRRGDLPAARRAFAEATIDAQAVGAVRLARLAREAYRDTGGRREQRPATGLQALSRAEHEVAELACAGRSNREIAEQLFLSPKTIENRLGRIYRKLGIAGRDQLRDALRATESA